MIGDNSDEEVFLLPLKKKDAATDRRCATWRYGSTATGCACGMSPERGADGAGCRFPDVRSSAVGRFADTDEWRKTKCTAAGLFRTLARHYDETWFPTVINEWSALYYRCNYSGSYWPYRDQWLAGDKEVRLEVWTEILRYRSKYDKRRRERCTEDEDAAKVRSRPATTTTTTTHHPPPTITVGPLLNVDDGLFRGKPMPVDERYKD